MKAISHSLVLAILICFLGCPMPLLGDFPPKDKAYFPSHLLQNENQFFVFSYNQDLRYAGGSILTLDLDKNNSVSSFVPIPSFADAPVFIENKSQILFLNRSTNQLSRLKIGSEDVKAIADLPWQDPYYLSIISESVTEVTGLIGYLSDRVNIEKLADVHGSHLENYGELQFFSTINKGASKSYLLQDIAPLPAPTADTKEEYDRKQSVTHRRISHIGGLRILEKDSQKFVFVGTDALPASAGFAAVNRQARLVWFAADNIEFDINKESVGEINLTSIMKAEKIAGFDISENNSVFVITEDPSLLVRVDLQKSTNGFTATYKKQAPLCEKPNDIRIAPNQKTLLVTCAQNNEVLAFNASDLELVGRDSDSGVPYGLGPVRILFDERDKNKPIQRAYVSYALDGTIGVFEVDNSSNGQRLKAVGRIFAPAPFNHPGGQ